jgi:hypothetical protein
VAAASFEIQQIDFAFRYYHLLETDYNKRSYINITFEKPDAKLQIMPALRIVLKFSFLNRK